MFEKLCAENARDFLRTVPADSVPASRLSVTIRGVNLDLYASVSLEKPDRVLCVWFLVCSSGDAVAAPPTIIGNSQAYDNNSDRSSGVNAHVACWPSYLL